MPYYSILHIPTGNFVYIEIFINDRTIQFKIIEQADTDQTRIEVGVINYFLSKEYADKFHKDRTNRSAFQIISTDFNLLSGILNNDHIYKHLYMDIYDVANFDKYNKQVQKEEFEIMEINYEETV